MHDLEVRGVGRDRTASPEKVGEGEQPSWMCVIHAMLAPMLAAALCPLGAGRTVCIRSSALNSLRPVAARSRIRFASTQEVMPGAAEEDEALQSSFLSVMRSRGYLYQCSNLKALDDLMSTETVPVYLGFDATASSLHVGSLLQIMILRRLQQNGHKPIVLVGGGTTKIGDPSGRDSSRQMLTDEKIEENIAGIVKVRRGVAARATGWGGPQGKAHRPHAAGVRALHRVWRGPHGRGPCEQR